jgi:hypothetical protein
MGYFDQMKAILGEGLADKKKPKPQFPNVLMAPPGPAMPSGTEQTPQPRPLEQTPLEKQQDFVNQDLMNPPPEPPSPYDAAKKDYESAVAAPAEKQPLWKQVLFVALQGVKQAATGDFSQPIQFLGNAKRDYKIQQAGARYGPLEQQRQNQQKYEVGQANLEVARQKPAIAQQRADATTIGAITSARRAEIAAQTQKWKETDRVKYWEWEGIKHQAKVDRDDKTYELAIRKQDEIERRNKVAEEDTDLNRTSREKIAGTQEAGRNARAGATESGKAERAKARLAQMSATQKAAAINGAVQKWISQNKGATAEQIAAIRNQLTETYK